jgi:PilZ domain
MAHVNERQWQRFSYHADVQLGWSGASPERRVQHGAVLDFSRGGMHVRTADALDVGAVVSCKVAWSGRLLSLPGRVRWSRRAPQAERANELGIEFGPLSAEETQRVQDWVAGVELGEQRVQLRVGAWPEPLEAFALPTEQGVRLRVALPWFATGSELQFELAQPATKFSGRIVCSELRQPPGTKQFELELRLEPREPARTRRYTMYETANLAHEGPTQPSAAALMTLPSAAEREIELVIPKSRGPGTLIAGLSLSLFAALVLLLPQAWRSSAWRPSLRPSLAATERPATRPLPAASVQPMAAASSRAIPSEAGAPAPAEAQVAPVVAAPTLADSETTTAPQTTDAASNTDQDRTSEPTLTVTGDTTEVFVPVQGSTKGLRTALWVEPLALVIDLPAGRVKLGRTRYAVHTGGIAALGVGNNHGVTQVRVFLDALLARYGTQELPDGLLIRLKRDLRPMP